MRVRPWLAVLVCVTILAAAAAYVWRTVEDDRRDFERSGGPSEVAWPD